jgi:hypothetical protein
MELIGDVGNVESHSGPFGDSVSVGARYVHGFRQTYHRLRIVLYAYDDNPRRRGLRGSSIQSIWS